MDLRRALRQHRRAITLAARQVDPSIPVIAQMTITADCRTPYGVSVEEYLAGQEWARENLTDLRRSAGLDPDTGLPVEPTNGVEPQPAAAPAAPAPRRNGHKASMVSHRVRR